MYTTQLYLLISTLLFSELNACVNIASIPFVIIRTRRLTEKYYIHHKWIVIIFSFQLITTYVSITIDIHHHNQHQYTYYIAVLYNNNMVTKVFIFIQNKRRGASLYMIQIWKYGGNYLIVFCSSLYCRC